MSQPAAHSQALAANSSSWIPLRQAALRMNRSEGHLRRKCLATWEREGLARRMGGSWCIHVGADSRLAERRHWRERDLEQLAELEGQVAAKYIEIARRRRETLHGFETYRLGCGSADPRTSRELYVAHLRAEGREDISVTTFYNWQRAYETDGVRGLVPAFAFRDSAESGAIGDAALDRLESILNCHNKISVAAALMIARGEAVSHAGDPGWRIGSYRSVLLALQKRPRILKLLCDKGERAALAGGIPKMERDFESIAAGDEWVGDERTLDVWCRVLTSRGWRAIRPKLTIWMDMRSRVIVGWVLASHANSETILAAFKKGIIAHGKPRISRNDRGRDYRAATKRPDHELADGQRVASIFEDLGIEIRPVGAYMPYAKPIESFFRGMKEHLDKLFAHFWAGSPTERHEDRAKYLRQNLEKLPTLEEVSKTLQSYIDCYHATPHSAVDLFGKTPLEAMAAFRSEPARMESDKVLDHLFRLFTEPKLVRRDGVRHNGRWYGNGDARLVAMQGQKVLLGIQPDDASRAMVCELDRTPKFEVECISMRGLTQREANEMVRERRKLLKPYREQARRGREFLMGTTPEKLLALRRAGIEAVHGRSVAQPPAAVANLRIRPALEDAIDSAGPAPSDAAQPSSAASRTGTDDAVTIDDFADNVRPAATEPDRPRLTVYDFLDE